MTAIFSIGWSPAPWCLKAKASSIDTRGATATGSGFAAGLRVGDSPGSGAKGPKQTSVRSPSPAKKLSYKLQRELNRLPQQIHALEQRVQTMESQVNSAEFYRQPQESVQATLVELEQTRTRLEAAVERWAALETKFQQIR